MHNNTINNASETITHMHTRTHNCFMAIFGFVWDYPGELASER